MRFLEIHRGNSFWREPCGAKPHAAQNRPPPRHISTLPIAGPRLTGTRLLLLFRSEPDRPLSLPLLTPTSPTRKTAVGRLRTFAA
jgi:hypothetical protein